MKSFSLWIPGEDREIIVTDIEFDQYKHNRMEVIECHFEDEDTYINDPNILKQVAEVIEENYPDVFVPEDDAWF